MPTSFHGRSATRMLQFSAEAIFLLTILLAICMFESCARQATRASTAPPPPPAKVVTRTRWVTPKECTLKGSVMTCKCKDPIDNEVDSRTNTTTSVVCKFHLEQQ